MLFLFHSVEYLYIKSLTSNYSDSIDSLVSLFPATPPCYPLVKAGLIDNIQ